MRSFSRKEIEVKFKELGGRLEGKQIKSDKWAVEVLEEKEVSIGKFNLKAVVLIIDINEENQKEFLENFRIKFSRGGG